MLRQQLDESSKALENLRKELRVYEQLYRLSSGRRNADSQTVGKAFDVSSDVAYPTMPCDPAELILSPASVGPSYGSEGPRSPRSETENDAIALLLAEIRSLRIQLEKSINTNNALRLKLEEQLARPLRSPAQSPGKVTVVRQLNFANLQSEETVCGGEFDGNIRKGPFTRAIFDTISRTKRALPYPAHILFRGASRVLERK